MNVSRHSFVSPKSDGPDATLVQPSKWNAEHEIGIELTNRTGGEIVAGDIVGLSDVTNESVVLADAQDTIRALVVALETVADQATGLFESTGAWPVKVNSATARGRYLAKSTTSKALYDTGVVAATTPPPPGAVAIALTSSGGAGTVIGLLLTSGAGSSGGVLFDGGNAASATELNIGNTGALFHVTGTTTITSITARAVGHLLVLIFDDAVTLTHNATSLILQNGRDYITEAGDVLWFVSEGSGNWRQGAPRHEALDYLILGATPATTGVVRLPNDAGLVSRNAANDADVALLSLNGTDRVVLGPGDATKITVGGQLRCDTVATTRVVLPVGTDLWAEEQMVPGSVWIETNRLRWVTATGTLLLDIGTDLGSPAGAVPGSIWIQAASGGTGRGFYYIDASGVKRRLIGEVVSSGVPPGAVIGSAWVQGSQLRFVTNADVRKLPT